MATPIRIRKPMPLKGRRTAFPADSIGQDYSPNALNVRFKFGEVRPAPGHGFYDHAVAAEKGLRIENFPMSTDMVWPLYLTDSKLFRRGNAAPGDVDAWFEVAGTLSPSGTRRWSTATGEDKFFFCRGSDEILYWDGIAANQFDAVSNVTDFEGIAGGTDGIAARCLEYFNNRVIAANVVEDGTTITNRIRWSENGDYRKWDETKQNGAGFLDLNTGGSEPIEAIKVLGEHCMWYRKHTIGHIVATGTLAPVHIEKTLVYNMGILCPNTLDSSGQAHFFVGTDKNVWMWDGSQLLPVGNNIHEELISLIYLNAVDKYYGRCIPSRFEYWLILCDESRGTFDVFVYDYLRDYWTRDTFANLYTIGEVEVPLPIYIWNNIPGIWTDWSTTSWADLNAGRVTATLGGRTDSGIMKIDEQIAFDYYTIGSIVDRVLETEDMWLDSPNDLTRLVRILLVYEYVNSTPFEVGVSFDRGRTWTTRNVTPEMRGISFVDIIATGSPIRFRFRENNANGSFRWRSYVCEYFKEGDQLGVSANT
jgi:hypothetical protein